MNSYTQYIVILVIGGVLYFAILRPRSKAARTQRTTGLNPGDDVVSNGGIFGVVTRAYTQRVFVEVSPGVEMIFDRRALTRLDAALLDKIQAGEAANPEDGEVDSHDVEPEDVGTAEVQDPPMPHDVDPTDGGHAEK